MQALLGLRRCKQTQTTQACKPDANKRTEIEMTEVTIIAYVLFMLMTISSYPAPNTNPSLKRPQTTRLMKHTQVKKRYHKICIIQELMWLSRERVHRSCPARAKHFHHEECGTTGKGN